MPYISPTGQRASLPSPSKPTTTVNPLTGNPVTTTSTSGAYPDWHKALLWFLGAVALLAIAAPAPNIATMLVLIIIFWVLLAHWNDYSMFLGIPNAITGGHA